MRSTTLVSAGAAAAVALMAGTASAAVISGPLLNNDGGGWTDTGLGFTANANSTLTGFTYQNQGAADTIVLTNAAGTILDSISTPAGTPSDSVSVDWSLSAGQKYFLLQTVTANELFTNYDLGLPSNADVTINISGTFDDTIAGAVSNSEGWGTNEYWAAFNNITTGPAVAAIPEPATWAMMLVGFGGLGGVMRSRRRLAPAAA